VIFDSDGEAALLDLLEWLRDVGYGFVTPTPETHRRVIARPDRTVARDLRGIFGWSLPFAAELLPDQLREPLIEAGVLAADGALLRSRLRVSGIDGRLFLHSAFPTDAADAVFFGPDSYRFVDFLRAELPRVATAKRLVDIGSGTGVGGITAASLLPGARISLMDVNRSALALAKVNASHAGVIAEFVEAESIAGVPGIIDLAIANPPYIVDDDRRSYRHGGDMHGARLSLDWTIAAARRIEGGGRVLLYTGAAIVAGRDALREALEQALPALGCTLRYRELDPDVFGEELDRPAYADVERIAVIGAVVEKT
jgi:methylase of polypeptide subunit release factors